jgi:hypothetical protein
MRGDAEIIIDKLLDDDPIIRHSCASDGAWRRKVMEWLKRKSTIVGVEIANWILVIGVLVIIWVIYVYFIR